MGVTKCTHKWTTELYRLLFNGLFQFVDGKVFLQTGKTMKPAAVRFVEEVPEEVKGPVQRSRAQEDHADRGAEMVPPLPSESSQDQGDDTPFSDKTTTCSAVPDTSQATTDVSEDFWTR